MNKEYEYSFKVTEIGEYINYCKKNNYVLEEEYEQIRKLYKNDGKVMGRITKNLYKDHEEEILNFKDDNLNDSILKERKESLDLTIDDSNRDFVKSLLGILDLPESKVLKRKRYIYTKQNVKFELDNYTEPKMNVVAIEGLKEEVDKVYNELKKLIENTKID